MKSTTYWIVVTCFFNLVLENLNAQDLHFSQFYHAPLVTNPARTGVYHEDMRFMMTYRSQWFSVPVPYNTVTLGFDQKLLNDGRLGSHILGAGVFLNYDKAGDSEMELVQVGGTIAYTAQLNQYHFIAGGLMASVVQRRFDAQKLTFDEQFIDGTFIATAPTNENFTNLSYSYLDIGVGINWLFQISKRMRFNFGSAVFHINTPKQGFFEHSKVDLPRKWNLYVDAVIQLGPKLDLMPAALYSQQGVQKERVFGTSVKYYLDQRFAREKGITFGVFSRMNDAIISVVGVHYPTWRAAISYDTNTSDFNAATNGVGGIELSFWYVLTKVKPPKKQRVCPIF